MSSLDLSKLPLRGVLHGPVSPKNPLMVVLHGRGDSPEGYEWLPPALGIPNLGYLMLQAPDPYFEGFSWYDLPPNQLPGILRSRQLLEEAYQEIEFSGFDLKRVFLFGFSQGCLMTLEFGARMKTPLAGYIGICGYAFDVEQLILEASPEAKARPWWVNHGLNDEILPVERTREQMKMLTEAGFNIEYFELSKPHAIDEEIEIPRLRQWVKALLH